MGNCLKTNDVNEVKAFYGRKYRPILNALEECKATNFCVDRSCGQ